MIGGPATGTDAETALPSAFASMSPERFARVKERLQSEGVNVAEWARSRNYTEALVYAVLSGRLRCRRGDAHKVAVALGLKDGVADDVVSVAA